jgi:hypothetical protein
LTDSCSRLGVRRGKVTWYELTLRSEIHAGLLHGSGRPVSWPAISVVPVLFGAQNATICAPRLLIAEQPPTVQIGGTARVLPGITVTFRDVI